MPVYRYKAATSTGLVVQNKVESASKQTLIKSLKANNLMPITVDQVSYSAKKKKEVKKNIKSNPEIMKYMTTAKINEKNKPKTMEKISMAISKTEKITTRDIVIFSQNFYLLKKAGFNNIHALETIVQSTENISFQGVLEDILAGVEAGEYMYTTMEYYGDIFPFIYINMIKVGELSGSLTNSLQQAVNYLDSSEALNKKIKGILIPNIVQFALLLVMLFVGTLVAIPAIQNIYDEMGSDASLPEITVWFQGVVNWILAYWYIPLLIVVAIVAVIIYYINTPRGKYNFDYFKYKMPIFGQLIFALDLSRFFKAMLLNLRNGMRIQEAMEVCKNVVSNYVMLSIIETALNNLFTGDSWIEPFEKSGLAKSMITEMLKIGMQTDLAEMMDKLVDYMEMDINNIMDKIMKTLPQVVYLIVGAVLIFFVVVVLVPCISVYMGDFLFSAAGV